MFVSQTSSTNFPWSTSHCVKEAIIEASELRINLINNLSLMFSWFFLGNKSFFKSARIPSINISFETISGLEPICSQNSLYNLIAFS